MISQKIKKVNFHLFQMKKNRISDTKSTGCWYFFSK